MLHRLCASVPFRRIWIFINNKSLQMLAVTSCHKGDPSAHGSLDLVPSIEIKYRQESENVESV
jgi:hypothetical protein